MNFSDISNPLNPLNPYSPLNASVNPANPYWDSEKANNQIHAAASACSSHVGVGGGFISFLFVFLLALAASIYIFEVTK